MYNIEKNTEDAIDLLKQLIAIPSYSREETTAADMFEAAVTKMGAKAKRINNNILLSTEIDSSKPTILLNSHIDTVKPSSSWTKAPHEATEEGDIIYGLGSNDAGASLVSLLASYITLSSKEQPYNLLYLASAEEEISGANGIELALKELPHIDFAIVGEPTEMQPAIAEKGLMVIDATAKGKAGHAARNEGINAIYEAMEDIKWISTYEFEKVSAFLGPVKMSATQINGGTKHNVVPDECHFIMDVRPNELYSNAEIFEIIDKHTKAEMKPRSFRLNSSLTKEDHPFLLRAINKGLVPYGSPTLSDQCLMSFSSVKMGPGHSSRSHTADEYIKKSEIRNAIPLYVELLDGLKIEKEA